MIHQLLGPFIVKTANLVEAEGRALRRASFDLMLAIMLLGVTLVLTLGSLALLAAGLYLGLAAALSPAAAMAITGGCIALIAAMGAMLTLRMIDRFN